LGLAVAPLKHRLTSDTRQSLACSTAIHQMTHLNIKKLLLTKWTAVTPVAKQKHFLVSRVIQPELDTDPVEFVEIEAVFSKAKQIIPWRDLRNDGIWLQGWV